MQVKFGMSNLLGDNGTGFVDAGMSFKGVGKARLRQKVAKKQWSFEKSPFSLDFDSLVFSGDAALMKVEMKRGKMHGLLEMQAVVPGFRPGSGRVEVPGEGFIECVVWPSLSVKGKIWNAETGASKEFTGNAVLTHSVTTLPPQFQPPRWFYFKGDDPDRPILLQGVQLGEEFGGKAYGWAVVVEGGSTVARVKGFAVTPVDLRPKDDATIPWGLYLEDKASGFEGAVKGTKLKKVADPLKRLPPVEAALVAKFIRPRNYFFDGEIELKVDGKTYKAKGLYRIDTLR
jgi:hypothetical protein